MHISYNKTSLQTQISREQDWGRGEGGSSSTTPDREGARPSAWQDIQTTIWAQGSQVYTTKYWHIILHASNDNTANEWVSQSFYEN